MIKGLIRSVLAELGFAIAFLGLVMLWGVEQNIEFGIALITVGVVYTVVVGLVTGVTNFLIDKRYYENRGYHEDER